MRLLIINEANEKQPLMKDRLKLYAPFYNIKPRAKTKEEVTPKADYGAPAINCGANCSQYTLQTRFGYSVLDMLDKGDIELYAFGGGANTIIFGSKNGGDVKVGDSFCLVDNDSYTRQFGTTKITKIINSRAEYYQHLKDNGYQVYPPRAFTKPTGYVSRGLSVYSLKGLIDLKEYLDSI